MLNLLEQGLVERPITRELSWGVPVPLKEAEDKVLYVWFEAPVGYISSTIEWAEKIGEPERWKDYWLDPETRLVHFIGKDNIIFHALIWPAVLMGQKHSYCLPHDIPANEFMNLEGQKISTSNNWAIWVDEFAQKFPADYLRYYLACNAPEKGDSDFSFRDFQQKINGDLNNVLGNLANRVFAFSWKNFAGKIAHPDLSEDAKTVLNEAERIFEQIDAGYREYQVKNNSRLGIDIARIGNRFFDERKPWVQIKENPKQVEETLWVCISLLRLASVALYPIMPKSMDRLRLMMGLEALRNWEKPDLQADYELSEAQPLFFKLEDAVIEREIESLRQGSGETKDETEPIKELISYDDFAKLDLRMAKILEAAPVKKTNKLLHLKVDIGNQQRELVAGIAEHYQPQDIIGKEVLMLVNLEPKTIRGVQSQGMILAVDTGQGLALLSPDKPCPPGSSVR